MKKTLLLLTISTILSSGCSYNSYQDNYLLKKPLAQSNNSVQEDLSANSHKNLIIDQSQNSDKNEISIKKSKQK